MAVTRPPKVKRSPSSRADINLTAIGEDLLTKKKAGQALTGVSFSGADVPKGSAQDDSDTKNQSRLQHFIPLPKSEVLREL